MNMKLLIDRKSVFRLFGRIFFIALLIWLFPLTARAADVTMLRLYNPNSGEHFYTAYPAERDSLVKAGWHDEGTAWYAPEGSAFPVYRLYNPNAGDHHYTMYYKEMKHLRSVGWNYEGVGWYSDPGKTVPVYRQYNPNAKCGSHNFTVSAAENEFLVTRGWKAEGISWYGVSRGKEKSTEKPDGQNPFWKITQYASVTGQQSMFYTIEDDTGNLAIVDGGYEEDKDQVLGVIRSHHNHVADWIITHPHPDHAGALNAILKENAGQRITIDHIYTTKVNARRYEETARNYDGIETFYTFSSLTEGMANLSFLSEDEEADILGLKMKVLHAWDDHVDKETRNLCNDGSLMFLLIGNKNRFLFCGDTQKEMEQYIIPAHKEELEADYVQCGHHGNWGLSTKFYDLVNPKEAFFDAPSYIVNDTTGKYDAPALKSYFLERGIAVHDFAHAPYTVKME